jgi:alpha-1,2-mannosyltransferase
MSRRAFGLAVAGTILTSAAILALRGKPWSMLDLDVYRDGAGSLLHGQSVYGDTTGLPFTYPPFAAVLFVPAYLVGRVIAVVVATALSLAGYMVLVAITARRSSLDRRVTVLMIVAGLAFEPVWYTLALGQVNAVLAGLVALDCLVLPERYRGWLVGLATGVKLVPGIFVLYFVLCRHWGAVARWAGAVAATIAVGAVFAPADSWRYWTRQIRDPHAIGDVANVGNQSIYGALTHLGATSSPRAWLLLPLAGTALALAVSAAWRQYRAGDPVATLTCLAIGGLLVSPVSWTHHWVWLVPAAVLLMVRGYRVSAAAVALTATVAPMWFTSEGRLVEAHIFGQLGPSTWWQLAAALSYTVVGLWVLVRLYWDGRPRGVSPGRERRDRMASGLQAQRQGRASSETTAQ